MLKPIKLLQKLFFKKKNKIKPRQRKDPYAPRGLNTVLPNDEFAAPHLNRWLDDVRDKHHG